MNIYIYNIYICIFIYTHIYIYIYIRQPFGSPGVCTTMLGAVTICLCFGEWIVSTACVCTHPPFWAPWSPTHSISWELTRIYGPSWSAVDIGRTALGATTMQFLACILYVKGDWAEYAGTLGLPNWNDGLRPCFGCNCDLDDMYDLLVQLSRSHIPYRLNEAGDYDVACSRCERLVVLDAATHAAVLNVLQYDKRKQGNRGRALTKDIPVLDLV